jgi:hypothetical protein
VAERGYRVVPRSQLKARLSEQKSESYRQCFDESCQIEIGKELAAGKSLATQVIKLGDKCKATLTLFDLKTAASEEGATHSGGCGEGEIVASLEAAVEKLQAGTKLSTAAAPPAREEAAEVEEEVRQPGRNLFWLRCPVGQKWNGRACEGTPARALPAGAPEACPPGYRLPSQQELLGLLEGCEEGIGGSSCGNCKSCADSMFCASEFGRGGGLTWASGSSWLFGTTYGYVNLESGLACEAGSGVLGEVRCVRAVLDRELTQVPRSP